MAGSQSAMEFPVHVASSLAEVRKSSQAVRGGSTHAGDALDPWVVSGADLQRLPILVTHRLGSHNSSRVVGHKSYYLLERYTHRLLAQLAHVWHVDGYCQVVPPEVQRDHVARAQVVPNVERAVSSP